MRADRNQLRFMGPQPYQRSPKRRAQESLRSAETIERTRFGRRAEVDTTWTSRKLRTMDESSVGRMVYWAA